MRLHILMLLAGLLAGCAGGPSSTPGEAPAPKQPEASSTRETRIIPEPAMPQQPSLMVTDAILANAFLKSYQEQSLYDNRHADTLLRAYAFRENRWSPQRDRLMMLFQNSNGDSGFVAWSLGSDTSATSLRLEDSQLGQRFALVLRPARLCFAVGAARAPAWIGGRWAYDPQRPGSFECNGLTNRSAFLAGTRLPALLGAYYSEGDTVLLFDSREQRDATAGVLARQFPSLVFGP